MPTRTKPVARRRGVATTPKPFIFTYRCPPHLIEQLNEARHILREPTRTGLVTKAITEYLARRGIPLQATG